MHSDLHDFVEAIGMAYNLRNDISTCGTVHFYEQTFTSFTPPLPWALNPSLTDIAYLVLVLDTTLLACFLLALLVCLWRIAYCLLPIAYMVCICHNHLSHDGYIL